MQTAVLNWRRKRTVATQDVVAGLDTAADSLVALGICRPIEKVGRVAGDGGRARQGSVVRL